MSLVAQVTGMYCILLWWILYLYGRHSMLKIYAYRSCVLLYSSRQPHYSLFNLKLLHSIMKESIKSLLPAYPMRGTRMRTVFLEKQATCLSCRCVYVWDALSRRLLYKLPGHAGSVNETALHPREPIGEPSFSHFIFCSVIVTHLFILLPVQFYRVAATRSSISASWSCETWWYLSLILSNFNHVVYMSLTHLHWILYSVTNYLLR